MDEPTVCPENLEFTDFNFRNEGWVLTGSPRMGEGWLGVKLVTVTIFGPPVGTKESKVVGSVCV